MEKKDINIQNGMIDYEELYDAINSVMCSSTRTFNNDLERLLNCLRPKMEWKPQFNKEYGYVIYYCSNCGNDELVKTPFCPQCGAVYEEDLK